MATIQIRDETLLVLKKLKEETKADSYDEALWITAKEAGLIKED